MAPVLATLSLVRVPLEVLAVPATGGLELPQRMRLRLALSVCASVTVKFQLPGLAAEPPTAAGAVVDNVIDASLVMFRLAQAGAPTGPVTTQLPAAVHA